MATFGKVCFVLLLTLWLGNIAYLAVREIWNIEATYVMVKDNQNRLAAIESQMKELCVKPTDDSHPLGDFK